MNKALKAANDGLLYNCARTHCDGDLNIIGNIPSSKADCDHSSTSGNVCDNCGADMPVYKEELSCYDPNEVRPVGYYDNVGKNTAPEYSERELEDARQARKEAGFED
jgi:hypothetical protein